jgi:protein TonB
MFAIALVALTHASLGYAITTGLAYTVIQKAPGALKTFNVEEVQPPQELSPSPKPVPENHARVVAPPPLVLMDAAPSPVSPLMPPSPPAAASIPPESPEPGPSFAAPAIERVPSHATADLQSLFRADDYPLTARERKEQGSVTVRLTIGVMGRVRACDVTSSSGSPTLDKASCQILQSRALFAPAHDSRGNLTDDTVDQEIRWVLG